MGATVQQIAGYLDKRGWKYRVDEAETRILLGVYADNVENFLVVIQLEENGEFFELFAPRVLSGVKDHPYKTAILQAMLCISWETKMLQWEYDPSDGEIRAIIEFPLEDSTLTERQFNRCLNSLIELVDEIALPRLKAVMDTGEDPGDPDDIMEGERLLLRLEQSGPGMLEMLERAMQARKRRGRMSP